MRSEKGSITIYVLLAMLTVTAVLMAIYRRDANAEMEQIETTEKIKAIYEEYDVDEVYASMTGAIPQILGYTRGVNTIIIKTLIENGANVDQNGKEILYYAATTESTAPAKENISETEGTFGQWQKSKEINIPEELEEKDIYIWIQNEDEDISNSSNLISSSSAKIGEGEYAKEVHKKYTDPTDSTKTAYIPAGFTVSNIEGETSISEGLVIYSGDQSNVTDMTTIQQTVNQYVWIPVDNPSDMYGIDASGNKLGKLYDFDTSGTMTALNWTEINGVMSWTNATSFQEPLYLSNAINADDSDYNQDANGNQIITSDGIQKEFNDMIESIERYHGFYIGRYELTGTVDKPTVAKGVWPLVDQNWYSLYQLCEKLELDTSKKVYTGMIWGSQWDQAIDKSIKNKSDFLSVPNKYGVYSDSIISERGVTGRMESAYNIFDMSGNVYDWTLEAYNGSRRVIRGGYYGVSGTYLPSNSRRSYEGPDYSYANYGCRAQLYLI